MERTYASLKYDAMDVRSSFAKRYMMVIWYDYHDPLCYQCGVKSHVMWGDFWFDSKKRWELLQLIEFSKQPHINIHISSIFY